MSTIIHGTRKLKVSERQFLMKQVGAAAGGMALATAAMIAVAVWALISADSGARFVCVLVVPSGLFAMHWLWNWSGPERRDLIANRVESVIGRVSALDLTELTVPLHLGEHTFLVRTDLLANKKLDQPILIEYIPHSGRAVAVDGRSNL